MTGRHVVAALVTHQAPLFEVAVPCEVFGIDRPELADPWYELKLCAPGTRPARMAHGLRLDTRYGLADLVRADTVLVPACAPEARLAPPGPVLDALREAHRRGARIVSICSGAYLLAAAGLLDGRRATTHWMLAADFAARFPLVELDPGVLFVDEGDVLTSAGTGAAVDLCLHLVRLDHGAAVANALARRLVVPPHRSGGQAQYVPVPSRAATAPQLAPVLDWARARLDRPLTVAELARQARMSQRTLTRRFREVTGVSPLRWLVRQRVRLAQELLESTGDPVEWIARRAGFGTAANLRLHFGREVCVSPQAYRRVFHRDAAPR